jgi:Cd(II)/Pb(II)-responsive transcriptional regulator
MPPTLTIGSLAVRANCPAETIRYYEREGLIPKASRTAGNYRLYSSEHLERLVFIRNCRSLDMTLDEIRQLLQFRDTPTSECDAAHALIDEHIAHLGARISELRQLQKQLQALRAQCQPEPLEKCSILDRLGRDPSDKKKRQKASGHVHGAHR